MIATSRPRNVPAPRPPGGPVPFRMGPGVSPNRTGLSAPGAFGAFSFPALALSSPFARGWPSRPVQGPRHKPPGVVGPVSGPDRPVRSQGSSSGGPGALARSSRLRTHRPPPSFVIDHAGEGHCHRGNSSRPSQRPLPSRALSGQGRAWAALLGGRRAHLPCPAAATRARARMMNGIFCLGALSVICSSPCRHRSHNRPGIFSPAVVGRGGAVRRQPTRRAGTSPAPPPRRKQRTTLGTG